MTHSAKALTLGAAALLAAAFNAPLFAQVANPAAGGAQGVNPAANARPIANANANAAVADDQHHTQQLIAHALGMAVNGSDLQLAAQAHGRYRQGQGRGEGQARNRNADNRNENQANNDARNANADNRRNDDANANRDNNADNRRNENANADRRDQNQDQHAIHQVRVQAWRQFENGERLLREANATLNAEGNNNAAAAGAGRDDSRNAWSRRLSTAAEQYASTLRALTGIGSRAPEATAVNDDQNRNDRGRADANQNQANRGNANENQADRGSDNQNARAGGLNRGAAAQVALLKQAVREAIEAFELNQAHHHAFGANQGGVVNASAQRLQEHARQMAADSQQLVQQVQAGLNNQQNNQDQNRQANQDRDRQGNQDRNAQNADARDRGNKQNNNARQGQASVRSLAQQAQQVVDTLQRITPAAGQGGAVR